MLLTVVEPIASCPEITAVIIVTNSLVASSLELAGPNLSVQLNDEPDAQMIDSVRLGVEKLQREQSLAPDDGILICPGDQPGLTIDDIARCCRVFSQTPEKIIIAAHDGKRGHPMIFPASLVPCVMSDACDAGLRELPQQYPQLVVTLELTTSAVVRNINTPPDYDGLSTA